MLLIYACTVFLTIICESHLTDLKDNAPNVGTVLFTANDMHKKQWSKTELGLLRARRYFQTLLPPPIFINTFNEDYVNILLGYFRDAYAAIKREATDPETDTIMTTALSDAIGGYLKVWVLPIAKLDYYGGTVSQSNVVKLFQFYNEIKRYLDTDGSGWRKPDENVLNSITINVAPLKFVSNTRSMKDPCENLAYFEKTADGLSIPIPNVNWNDKSSTMFIPLKNVSLIMMNTPDTAHNLIKYYDAARSCIQTSNPKEQEKFDEKFQNWLTNEVVPHLKDENLYLALGSVLTLVNRTRDLCNSVMDIYGNKYSLCKKPQNRVACVDLSCKKVWIITVILLIEIAWCIPALVYILCSKRLHKKDCSSNVYLFIDNNKLDKKDKGAGGYFKAKTSCLTETTEPLEKMTVLDPNGTVAAGGKSGIKLHRKSQLNNVEFEGQYPSSQLTNTVGTGSRSVCVTKEQSNFPGDKSHESIAPKISEGFVSKKSSLKKNSYTGFPSDQCQSKISTQLVVLSSQEAFCCNAKRSGTSYATIPPGPCSSPIADEPPCVQKSRRRREKDEHRRHEKQRTDESYRNERKKVDEGKKLDDRRKAEESKKLEACRKAEENRKHEECRKADECRKLEERRKAEECKKPEKQEECRKVEECRKLEKQEDSKKRRVHTQKPDDCRKLEERRKLEECRKLDEGRKRDECREVDESKKLEDRRKLEECRRRRKIDHSRKVEECRKLEETRNLDECRKFEETRQLEECRKLEKCREIDEYTLDDESRDDCEDKDVCRIFDECRDLERLDDCRRHDERCCIRTEDSCLVSEIKYDNLESASEYKEYCAFEETCNVVESLDNTPCRKPCPCTDCITKGCFESTSNSTCREVTSESLTGSKCLSDKQVETKTTRFQVTKELRTVRAGGKGNVKLPSGKPYLEITIDRPATEICVDMGQCRQHLSPYRPSKIPKLATTCSIVQPVSFISRQPSTSTAHGEKHKSLIPQLKKKTVDDMALSECRCSRSSESKLNDTF